jgi:NADH-quinone oxidoreductase subunit L
MWRSYYLTYEGPHAKPEIAKKVHESPGAITYVLSILAALSMVAGAFFGFSLHLFGQHAEPMLEEWLHPVLQHAEVHFTDPGLGFEYTLMALSVGLAVVSWGAARRRYGPERASDWQTQETRLPLFEAIQNKYWVDEIYQSHLHRVGAQLRSSVRHGPGWWTAS